MSDLQWTQEFIGIPDADKGRSRDGADCWGLGMLLYRARNGIELPGYDALYATSAERREIAAIVAREAGSALWEKIAEPAGGGGLAWRRAPRELDVLWFRRGRHDAHAGFWLKAGWMIHMREGMRSAIERFDVPEWSSRLTGAYHWRGLP